MSLVMSFIIYYFSKSKQLKSDLGQNYYSLVNYLGHLRGVFNQQILHLKDMTVLIMKEDQDIRGSIFLRASQNSEKQEQSQLFASISRTFATPATKKNRLIFMSRAISLPQSLSFMIFQSVCNRLADHELTLLIDFQGQQIDYLNECLQMLALTKPLPKTFDSQSRKQMRVVRLNTLTIQKRKACYIHSGVYAVSTQIFLTDLLRGQATIQPRHITKIIVKLTERVKTYYNYYGWMSTMMKIYEERNGNKHKIPILFVCNQPRYYAFEEDLKQIYRIFFCDKVVIWPFGRAQIHKRLSKYRQKKTVREWEHSLSHSEGEKTIEEILFRLLYFLKKTFVGKYGENANHLDDIIYGRVNQQSFAATRGEFIQLESVKLLFSLLDNTDKLSILNRIARFVQEGNCELWSSNNNQVIQMIEALTGSLKENMFYFQKTEVKRKVNLQQLLFDENKGTLNLNQIKEYRCQFEIDINLILKIQQNEKIRQLTKVIEDFKNFKRDSGNDIKLRESDNAEQYQIQGGMKTEQAQQRLAQDVQRLKQRLKEEPVLRQKNMLIMCNTKSVSKYVTSSLSNYSSDSTYFDYLLRLQFWLKSERVLRLTQLKRIYEKRKIKAGEQSTHRLDYKCSQVQRVTEIKIILQQMLLREIERLQSIILDYQLQQNILGQQLRMSTSEDSIFNLNKEILKLKQRFGENLMISNFMVIDVTRIRIEDVCYAARNKLSLDIDNGKLNLVVSYFNMSADITHFYSLLKNINPQVVIFYSPNTHLVRSLYLFQIDAAISKLENIHILSYTDSYESKAVKYQVIKQDKAFWEITQKRSGLSDFVETPFLRVKTLSMHDSYQKAVGKLSGHSLFKKEQQKGGFSLSEIQLIKYPRVIIVDSRQFKSSLPSHLYHYGFEVVPMFLKSADYILSDDVGVEKKSVNTRDLQISLRSNRLEEQLRRMNTIFKRSYLLIQFQEEKDCRKDNFSGFQFNKNDRDNPQSRQLRRRLINLVHKYQKVRLIWSTSVRQSCEYFKMLKMDQPQPDLLKFQKMEAEEQPIQVVSKLSNIQQVSAKRQVDE